MVRKGDYSHSSASIGIGTFTAFDTVLPPAGIGITICVMECAFTVSFAIFVKTFKVKIKTWEHTKITTKLFICYLSKPMFFILFIITSIFYSIFPSVMAFSISLLENFKFKLEKWNSISVLPFIFITIKVLGRSFTTSISWWMGNNSVNFPSNIILFFIVSLFWHFNCYIFG